MANESETCQKLVKLKASFLRDKLKELQTSYPWVDARVTGTKAVLAQRVLEGLKVSKPGNWEQEVKGIVSSYGASAKKTKRVKGTAGRFTATSTSTSGQRTQGMGTATSFRRNSGFRSSSWPLYVDKGRLDRAYSQEMFLVERNGLTQFTVVGASLNAYQVRLVVQGRGPSCSCPDHQTRRTVCKHILFALLRILHLSPEDLLAGLERDTVQSAAEAELSFGLDVAPEETALQKNSQRPEVAQRPLDKDDTCAICCCDFGGLAAGSPKLVYCRFSCGKSLHAHCFEMLRKFDQGRRRPVLCVYCRQPWAD
uniref:Ring finger domain protein n=1 Tax=Tetraselmis sp. GSL018 TaxID=582737 RepID=A0A061S1L4_9CHLO